MKRKKSKYEKIPLRSKEQEKKFERIAIKRKNLAKHNKLLAEAIKRLEERAVSEEQIMQANREFGKTKTDLEKVEKIVSRLKIHSGDLDAIIKRIERIIRLEIALNDQKGISKAIELTNKKNAFKEALQTERQILKALSEKMEKFSS